MPEFDIYLFGVNDDSRVSEEQTDYTKPQQKLLRSIWTQEENNKLCDLVKQHGDLKGKVLWEIVSEYMKKTPKACQSRFAKITKNQPQNIKTAQGNFLQHVAEKYKTEMSQSGTYGGDLEIGAIANNYNVAIKIHKPNGTVIVVINPDGGNGTVNLLYADEHYQSYDPNTGAILSNDGNGDCLFLAIMQELGKLGIEHPDMLGLRKTTVATIQDDSIRVRYQQIFKDQDQQSLDDAIGVLPNGKVTDEAVRLARGKDGIGC